MDTDQIIYRVGDLFKLRRLEERANLFGANHTVGIIVKVDKDKSQIFVKWNGGKVDKFRSPSHLLEGHFEHIPR